MPVTTNSNPQHSHSAFNIGFRRALPPGHAGKIRYLSHPNGHAPCSSGFPEEHLMLLTLAIILLIAWALGFLAFHIATSLIHVVIVVAVILLVLHFVRGRS